MELCLGLQFQYAEGIYQALRVKSTSLMGFWAGHKRFWDARALVLPHPFLMAKYMVHMPPFHSAARLGDLGLLKPMVKLVAQAGSIDTPFHDRSALLYAMEARCVHCIQCLLDAGACANFNVHPMVRTPLRYAVEECSDVEIIKLLIDYDAEHALKTRFSSPMEYVLSRLSPCHDAEERRHFELILQCFEETN